MVPTFSPVKNATKILLDSVDYFTISLTGISGIFVNNLPLSFSTCEWGTVLVQPNCAVRIGRLGGVSDRAPAD